MLPRCTDPNETVLDLAVDTVGLILQIIAKYHVRLQVVIIFMQFSQYPPDKSITISKLPLSRFFLI